jgi:hypothetical protein
MVKSAGSEGGSKRWVELFRDAESALADGPAGERAQGLVARWTELKRESEAKQSRNVSRLGGFQEVLGNNRPSQTPVAVVNQVARLYRIEQVSHFLESALERISDGRDSA